VFNVWHGKEGVLQAFSADLTLSLPVTALRLYHDWETTLEPCSDKKSSSRLALFHWQSPACTAADRLEKETKQNAIHERRETNTLHAHYTLIRHGYWVYVDGCADEVCYPSLCKLAFCFLLRRTPCIAYVLYNR
jgi:hypothetical protein